jgi:hypothetical protein
MYLNIHRSKLTNIVQDDATLSLNQMYTAAETLALANRHGCSRPGSPFSLRYKTPVSLP